MALPGERTIRAVGALLVVVLSMASGAVAAQDQAAQAQTTTYKPEELEALVAPIALYPDPVLSQALMAATYPLEIVLAARWLKANPNIKGDAAVKAVENQAWDVSVKSLVAFPQVLEPMNDKLDWTQKLGDAFLADQKGVLDAVQRLRVKAQEAGNLKSNEQQTVIVEPATTTTTTIVKIEPANPEVIYVPAYDPTYVYGAWAYPYYPPYYWPPYPAYYPGYAFGAGIAWGIGFAVGAAIIGGITWGGNNPNVNININKAANIDRNFDRSKVGQGGRWEHDAGHRKGVAYRDNATRERFGRGSGAEARNNFRGRDFAAGDRGAVANRAGAGVADRGNLGNRPQTADRPSVDRGAGSTASRDRAFQGVGGGSASQRDFDRGRSSAGSSSFNRPSGGGARGGGGGARGGGGGRGGGRR